MNDDDTTVVLNDADLVKLIDKELGIEIVGLIAGRPISLVGILVTLSAVTANCLDQLLEREGRGDEIPGLVTMMHDFTHYAIEIKKQQAAGEPIPETMTLQ